MCADFGIYIKTCRRDEHLAQALIMSLKEYAPGVNITIIPDDDMNEESLWGYNCIKVENQHLNNLRGFLKKFLVFFGPYERFIYLDADILALRDLSRFVEFVKKQEEPFLCVNRSSWMQGLFSFPPEQYNQALAVHLGDVELLERFDQSVDWSTWNPFNSGLMASTKGIIDDNELIELHEKMNQYTVANGRGTMDGGRSVFKEDQGILNYIALKKSLNILPLEDIFVWGSQEIPDVNSIEKDTETGKYLFVHWAGNPKPTIWNWREMPGGELWLNRFSAFHKPVYRWPSLIRKIGLRQVVNSCILRH